MLTQIIKACALLLAIPVALTSAFQSHAASSNKIESRNTHFIMMAQKDPQSVDDSTMSRRGLFQKSLFAATTAFASTVTSFPQMSWAASRPPLDECLYTLLRVREATEQETRLIKSGKFKDIQRANIKLAVKFMVENYRLADTFVAASAYLDGTDRRIAAGQIGQTTVQNLQTILEYFDSSDVQNLKVGSNALAGKEQLVLKGLDAARRNLDDFLAYFPTSDVDAAKEKLMAENKLNESEFDPNLGVILNLKQSPST